MIILSQNLILNPPPEPFGPNNPIVGYRSVATLETIEADHEDALRPVANLANPRTDIYWQSTEIAEQHLTVTIEDVAEQDYVGVANHNFGSAGIPVSVEYGEFDNETWGWTELIEPFVPPDDAPLLMRFEKASYEAIRLKLGVGTEPPRCAVLYVGDLLVFERRIYVGHTPVTDGLIVEATAGRSQRGNYLGTVETGRHNETSVSLQNLSPGWYREHMRPFIQSRTPFFWGWRPQSYPMESGFGWFPAGHNPQPSNQRPNGMVQVDFDIEGIV